MILLRIFVSFLVILALVLLTTNLNHVLATTGQSEPQKQFVLGSHSNSLYGITAAQRFEETKNFLAAVHYPVMGNPLIDNQVQAYVDSIVENLAAQAARPASAPAHSTLYADYQLFAYSDEVISVKFDISMFGSIKAEREVKTLTFNLRTGLQLGVKELFNIGYKTALFKYAAHLSASSFQGFAFTPTHLICFVTAEDGLDIAQVHIKLTDLLGVINFRVLNGGDPYTAPPSRSKAPKIALTFDDGPHPIFTAQILNELRKHNAVATFFVLGTQVEREAGLIRRMAAEGHEIGNHTWSHANLSTLSPQRIANEIGYTNQVVRTIVGDNPKIMRPPYGLRNDTLASAVEAPIIMWSIDPKDWESRDADAIIEHIEERVTNGDIILLHDLYQSTAEAVGPLLDMLVAQGFEFVTVSELLSLNDYPASAVSGEVYYRR